jgi:hypothetical protein
LRYCFIFSSCDNHTENAAAPEPTPQKKPGRQIHRASNWLSKILLITTHHILSTTLVSLRILTLEQSSIELTETVAEVQAQDLLIPSSFTNLCKVSAL